jgi:hypothetical protein
MITDGCVAIVRISFLVLKPALKQLPPLEKGVTLILPTNANTSWGAAKVWQLMSMHILASAFLVRFCALIYANSPVSLNVLYLFPIHILHFAILLKILFVIMERYAGRGPRRAHVTPSTIYSVVASMNLCLVQTQPPIPAMTIARPSSTRHPLTRWSHAFGWLPVLKCKPSTVTLKISHSPTTFARRPAESALTSAETIQLPSLNMKTKRLGQSLSATVFG